MPGEDRATWKSNCFLKIIQLLDHYPKCFIVGADNMGSKQRQQIPMSLCGKAVVLMGKNTMMCKAIKGIWKTTRLWRSRCLYPPLSVPSSLFLERNGATK